jgi:hypothetical protein
MTPATPRISRWPRRLATLLALAVATGSVVWSTHTIRRHLRESRREAMWEVAARSPQRDPPWAEPVRKPAVLALAALASRRETTSLDAAGLFGTTNVWTVHLRIPQDQAEALEPRYVEPLDRSWMGGGRFELRNPAASRNGLSGVRGLEFGWVHATVEFEDRTYSDAAVRHKGNGTYLRSEGTSKRPYKVDLDKYSKGRELAGRNTLNFANLVVDDSCLHDALGHEFFRSVGVPAPRTAFARLFRSTGTAQPEYLGVYALIENLDSDFAAWRFGTRKGVVFKPVTTELFSDLGDDWAAYEGIYDPKSRPTEAQKRRVIELARLVTSADDATFAARIGEFVELDEFTRFLAGMVLLSSYDGFLNNGQNFCLWLDPVSERFQFLPWDLDNAWGKFGWAGSASDRARASIRRPWMGNHRFLERMWEVPGFEERYRQALGRMLETGFVPKTLHERVDELAAVLRPVVAEESPIKAARFELAVTGTQTVDASADGPRSGRNRPPHPLKWFISARSRSVRAQLAGEEEGILPVRRR